MKSSNCHLQQPVRRSRSGMHWSPGTRPAPGQGRDSAPPSSNDPDCRGVNCSCTAPRRHTWDPHGTNCSTKKGGGGGATASLSVVRFRWSLAATASTKGLRGRQQQTVIFFAPGTFRRFGVSPPPHRHAGARRGVFPTVVAQPPDAHSWPRKSQAWSGGCGFTAGGLESRMGGGGA